MFSGAVNRSQVGGRQETDKVDRIDMIKSEYSAVLRVPRKFESDSIDRLDKHAKRFA